MTTSDLDPDALDDWAAEWANKHLPGFSFNERGFFAQHLRDAEQRGIASQRATIERLELALGEAIDTLKSLANDNPWAEWVAVPMIVGDETVVSRLESALTARAPGVTGKGEGE